MYTFNKKLGTLHIADLNMGTRGKPQKGNRFCINIINDNGPK